LIQFSGGFEADALLRRVQINRILPPAARVSDGKDRVVIELAPAQFANGNGPAFTLQPGDEVTVFGVAPNRRGFVTLTGNVWVTGPIGYTAGMKLSDALRLAGGPKPDFYQGQLLVSRLQPDSTRIQLRSAFRDSLGTLTQDLTLADEDEIQVFSRSDFRPTRSIAVTGAVRAPGRLPFRDGMTLRDAILQLKGLTEDADLREAEIARLPKDRTHGEVATTIRVPLDSTYLFERGSDGSYFGPPGLAAMAKGAADVALEPYDNVLILRQPGWEMQRTVSITGQVKFPGRYALRTSSDRISDVLQRAGGLTATAYPTGASFVRPTDRSGRIGIDLPRLLADNKFRDNLILFGGDSLFVPEYNPVVMVAGAVNSPVTVAYVPGKNLTYYVQSAGGFTQSADAARAYVTQPSGAVKSTQRRFFLIPNGLPTPLAGAHVFVPEKVKDPNKGSTIASIAGIITSVVTVLIVAIKP
jgi:protein involved in polysaccharide export with SLBB domain